MLATLAQLKTSLGIASDDTTKDALLTSSLMLANGLITGYLGFDPSATATVRPYTTIIPFGQDFLKLPFFPVLEVQTLSTDGNPVALDSFWLNESHGIIEGLQPSGLGNRHGWRCVVSFRAGYEVIPDDLVSVCLNIAGGIFNNGGTINSAASGGTGELKSLTMFDAMSMSFDVGSADSGSSNTPEGLVKQWDFILRKYSINEPALA